MMYIKFAVTTLFVITSCNSLPVSKEALNRTVEVPMDSDIDANALFAPPTRSTVQDCSFHHNGMYYYEDPNYASHFIYKNGTKYVEIDRNRKLKLVGDLHHYDDCSYTVRYVIADNLENANDVVGKEFTYYILESNSRYHTVSLSQDGSSQQMKLIRYDPRSK